MSDLDPAAYLAAALDTAEATAQAAVRKTGVWEWSCAHEGMETPPPSHDLCARLGGCGEEIDLHDDGGHTVEQAAHIAANDPAQVLRMVAAHRKLTELHGRRQLAQHEWFGSDTPGAECVECEQSWPCDTIQLLAGAYGWTETP
jgi:Family of unknown function (DUF6221)